MPRRRTRWQFIAGPPTGGHSLALTEAKNRRLTVKLTEASELSFNLDGRHPQAAALDELATDIHLLWTPPTGTTRLLFRGRVGTTSDTLDQTTHDLSVTVLDYRAVLSRRILYSDSTLTWTATDQAAIAWGLIQQTQTRASGNLGISRGSGQTTGITRDRTYQAGDSIGQRIGELSELIDGFDWDITPGSPSLLTLDVFHPQRGTNNGVVLEHGGLVTKLTRNVDPADYANAIRYSGADGLTAQELQAADIATVPQGRWDAAFGDTDLTTQTALNDRAAWQLDQSQVLQPTYTLTLRQDAWDGPDHIWLGDPVRLLIRSGRLKVDTWLRVYELAFTITEDQAETVEITLGGPRPDYRKRASAFARRLSTLERR